ncbi:MBL fold metallo-hydrolase [Brachybacterium endophyticum]|uniref:MBL fold metallo-hydrolase n=1 Tax=Brachybacterium endophyticum TaxID=2182385 RepID=A0A2U2RQA3_9MICO|nr:MBL fold metallo-hydrolase [Brachybacterium endophyticum]PWH07954.1 MBL fold metallo-hydrolase [Brachybacterium endophyticum]
MRIRHLGHSCLAVEAADTRVLVDPGSFSDAEDVLAAGPYDAVAITHQHADHVAPALLARVLEASPQALVLAEPQTAAGLRGETELPGGAFEGTLPADRLVELPAGSSQRAGGIEVAAVGGDHAVIHPDIPRVGNSGLVLSTPGEPRLGITGDSLEEVPEFEGIDVLAFAVVAPWSKMRETIDFLRAVRPGLALPVHDAVVSTQGRTIYITQSTNLAPEGTEVRDWPEGERVVEVAASER